MAISSSLKNALELASKDSQAWLAVCDKLAEEFDALGTLLLPIDKNRRLPWLIASERLVPAVTEYLAGGWSTNDVRERGLPAGRERGYVLDSDVGSEDELNKLPYYRELLRPHGIGGLCAILFEVKGVEWAMSIQLPLGTFVPDDGKLALIPEIRASLELAAKNCWWRVNEVWEARFKSASFEGSGMAVLDVNGNVVRKNEAFSLLLKESTTNYPAPEFPDPFTRSCVDRFCVPGENFFRPAPYLIGHDANLISCTIRRIPEDVRIFSTQDIAVLSVSRHSSFDDDVSQILASKFDLLPSEIHLVLEICKGRKLKAAAKSLGITEGTARQRLKAVFRKTGSETQHQLVVNVMKARAVLPPN